MIFARSANTIRSISIKLVSHSPTLDRIRSNLGDVHRTRTEFCQLVAEIYPSWASSTEFGPMSAKFCLDSAQIC